MWNPVLSFPSPAGWHAAPSGQEGPSAFLPLLLQQLPLRILPFFAISWTSADRLQTSWWRAEGWREHTSLLPMPDALFPSWYPCLAAPCIQRGPNPHAGCQLLRPFTSLPPCSLDFCSCTSSLHWKQHSRCLWSSLHFIVIFPDFLPKAWQASTSITPPGRRRKWREEKHAIARKLTKSTKFYQLIWSQHYLASTEEVFGPAQNNTIAQLQTIPATVYPCKYLQTKSEILQLYERRPQIFNNFTLFLVYICLNAIYDCCFFIFSLCKVQLSFPSLQKGIRQRLKYYPKFMSKVT